MGVIHDTCNWYVIIIILYFKVLKIVVCLLEEGHPDFHRNLQKTPEAFKESASTKTLYMYFFTHFFTCTMYYYPTCIIIVHVLLLYMYFFRYSDQR